MSRPYQISFPNQSYLTLYSGRNLLLIRIIRRLQAGQQIMILVFRPVFQ